MKFMNITGKLPEHSAIASSICSLKKKVKKTDQKRNLFFSLRAEMLNFD